MGKCIRNKETLQVFLEGKRLKQAALQSPNVINLWDRCSWRVKERVMQRAGSEPNDEVGIHDPIE
jgi:hypothetical protein